MRLAEVMIHVLDLRMKEPELYGWFHVLCLVLTVIVTIALCKKGKKHSGKQVVNIIFGTAVIVTLLEIYKQINFTFTFEDGKIVSDYSWYAFPWQFCSMPMYVGILCGIIRRGKIHRSLCAFLSTYSTFAGIAVMLYPASVFTEVIGINIQTMVCHASMVVIGIYLLYIGYVKIEFRTIVQALPVFAIAVAIAVCMNEVAYCSGLLETDDFNMFMISPYLESTLPIYSAVQKAVSYPWNLIVYIVGFTVAVSIVLLVAKKVSLIRR